MPKMNSKLQPLLLLLCLLLCLAGMAQQVPQPLVIGQQLALHSEALGEDRLLNVYLPDAYYSDSTTPFPVIYLLDGTAQEDMLHIMGLVQFLRMIEAIPPSIVVGIANVDRKRDFTFPTHIEKDKEDFPTTGGSAAFMNFLRQELQPLIQLRYRCTDQQTLIGQSLGGLLASEILLKYPETFDNYLIVSPSFWWDGESLLKAAPALLKLHDKLKLKVFLCVGNEHKIMVKDALAFEKVLKAAPNNNLKIKYQYFPDEDHRSVLHVSAYAGLKWLLGKP